MRGRAFVFAALLLIAGGLIAYAVVRGGDESDAGSVAAPATTTRPTRTATETSPAGADKRNMLALDYHTAVGLLLALGFLPETFPVESPHPRGLVVGQVPSWRVQLAPGSRVQLNVSLGKNSREGTPVPDLTGLRLPDAITKCAEAGFTCRAVTAVGSRLKVVQQRPAAGRVRPTLTQIALTTG